MKSVTYQSPALTAFDNFEMARRFKPKLTVSLLHGMERSAGLRGSRIITACHIVLPSTCMNML